MIVTVCVIAATGLWCVIRWMIPDQVRLDDALRFLDVNYEQPRQPVILADPGSRLERWALRFYQFAHIPISHTAISTLAMQGRTLGDFMTEKLAFAAGGILAVIGIHILTPIPIALTPLVLAGGAVGGFVLPDVKLRRQRVTINADSAEALNTFFDLIVLERLANLSAVQVVEAAAEVSDVPIFARIRAVAERARAEKRAPWSDLIQLADELGLPQIADVANVMRLDDQGAALVETLVRRVQELRDAHLADEQSRAQQQTENMTLWMTIPVLLFALGILMPPLLGLTGIA